MKDDNIFTRIYRMFLNPKEVLKSIINKPTRFSIIITGIILFYSLIFYFLFFNPNLWRNIFFIQFSGLTILELIGVFFIVIIIISLISISLLLIINFLRQIITKRGKKRKLLVLNIYFYSLDPFLILLTQLPFLIIFSGHYQLFNLSYFYIIIYFLTISIHIFYLSYGLKISLKISWKKTLIFTVIYSCLLIFIILICFYIIFYTNISYTWLGSLV